MLPGFDEETCNLSDYELKLVAGFVTSFKKYVGPENTITSFQIIEKYSIHGVKISGARVRKIISYIRTEGLVPGLMASSKGYYITTDPVEMGKWIESLQGRVTKIGMIMRKAEQYKHALENHGQQKMDL
jgi:hypothetical protein